MKKISKQYIPVLYFLLQVLSLAGASTLHKFLCAIVIIAFTKTSVPIHSIWKANTKATGSVPYWKNCGYRTKERLEKVNEWQDGSAAESQLVARET